MTDLQASAPEVGKLPPQFFTTRTFRDGYLVLALHGELDASVAPGFRAELTEATAYDQHLVEVDLSKLDFIDSSGVSVLVSSLYALRAQGGQLTLVAPQRQALLTFETLNEAEFLDIKCTSTASHE
jgi:anti-sigma B factor antagonist